MWDWRRPHLGHIVHDRFRALSPRLARTALVLSPADYRRGFLVDGPRFVTPSDLLARLIDAARLSLTAPHYAPDPREQRRAHRLMAGRAVAARYGRRVRPWEC